MYLRKLNKIILNFFFSIKVLFFLFKGGWDGDEEKSKRTKLIGKDWNKLDVFIVIFVILFGFYNIFAREVLLFLYFKNGEIEVYVD